ncbi:MAG: HIT domain-containing protein [Candidatus Pacearchaeota archaeon]
MDKNCIFCKIADKEIKVEIIYENDNFIAFPDVHPKVEGHTLIVSKKHFINSFDLPSTLGNELLEIVKEVVRIKMEEDKSIGGFNIVQNNFPTAGQVVMHTHFHILPRRKNDGFRLNGL